MLRVLPGFIGIQYFLQYLSDIVHDTFKNILMMV